MARFGKRRRARTRKRTFKKQRKVARLGTVKRMISSREETKWINGLQNLLTVVDNNPAFLAVNAMTKGTDRTQRIANRISMKKFAFTITMTPAPNGNRPVYLRYLVIMDKQPNATAAPNFQSLFSGSVTPANADEMWKAMYNVNTVPSRYKILLDRNVTSTISGGSVNVAQNTHLRRHAINLRSNTVYADTNTGTINDIQKNSLWLLIVNDWPNGNPNSPLIQVTTQFKYKDA